MPSEASEKGRGAFRLKRFRQSRLWNFSSSGPAVDALGCGLFSVQILVKIGGTRVVGVSFFPLVMDDGVCRNFCMLEYETLRFDWCVFGAVLFLPVVRRWVMSGEEGKVGTPAQNRWRTTKQRCAAGLELRHTQPSTLITTNPPTPAP